MREVSPWFGVQTTKSVGNRHIPTSGRILELGCGRSSVVVAASSSASYAGIEVLEPNLTPITEDQRLPIGAVGRVADVRLADVLEIDVEEKSVDWDILLGVREHLSFDGGHALLEKLNNRLQLSCSRPHTVS